jgi:carboxyl-terminal processing protease
VEFIVEKGHFKVIAPIDESPVAKAGVKTNDIITHVDGVSVEGFKPDQLVLDKLIGPVGSQVRLIILREGKDKPVELTLVREMGPFQAVRTRQDGGDIGYLGIRPMNEWTMSALEKAIRELSSQIPAKAQGLRARFAQRISWAALRSGVDSRCVPGGRRDRLSQGRQSRKDRPLQRQ